MIFLRNIPSITFYFPLLDTYRTIKVSGMDYDIELVNDEGFQALSGRVFLPKRGLRISANYFYDRNTEPGEIAELYGLFIQELVDQKGQYVRLSLGLDESALDDADESVIDIVPTNSLYKNIYEYTTGKFSASFNVKSYILYEKDFPAGIAFVIDEAGNFVIDVASLRVTVDI